MSADEPTWITHAFVPSTLPKTAYYLRRSTGDAVYEVPIVGVLIQHEVLASGPSPIQSETSLAYIDGVDVMPAPDGPRLVGVYPRDEQPTAADIKVARAAWALYLRQQQERVRAS